MKKIKFIGGSMNASKSATLIMRNYAYLKQGLKTAIIKPNLDTRDNDMVVSRAFEKGEKAFVVCNADELIQLFDRLERESSYPDVVLVDEVQFMDVESIKVLESLCYYQGTTVEVYGLVSGYLGEVFPSSQRLLTCADIHILNGLCDCGNEAYYNMRLVNGIPFFGEAPQIAVGDVSSKDAVSYEPKCGRCYLDAERKYGGHDEEETENDG